MNSPVISLRDVSKVHRAGQLEVSALRDVTLDINRREFVAIMGPSGSGKSTLLNMIGVLDQPTLGRVSIDGTDVGGLSPRKLAVIRRRRIGFVFQDYNLVPSLTGSENVSLPLDLDGSSPKASRKAAIAALDELGLADLANRFPHEMSGGQQQRVAIARALIGERDVLLADEPTGALDSVTGEDILELLRRRCDAGAAVVMVTHEARHAAYADRVLYIRDGQMVDDTGSPIVSTSHVGSA